MTNFFKLKKNKAMTERKRWEETSTVEEEGDRVTGRRRETSDRKLKSKRKVEF